MSSGSDAPAAAGASSGLKQTDSLDNASVEPEADFREFDATGHRMLYSVGKAFSKQTLIGECPGWTEEAECANVLGPLPEGV